jgi:hypothetical protein
MGSIYSRSQDNITGRKLLQSQHDGILAKDTVGIWKSSKQLLDSHIPTATTADAKFTANVSAIHGPFFAKKGDCPEEFLLPMPPPGCFEVGLVHLLSIT